MGEGPRYTASDMKKLVEMSVSGSVPAVFLPDMVYDPGKFRGLLEEYNLKKDILYLFETPLSQVPLLINKGEVSGYLQFRLSVGK